MNEHSLVTAAGSHKSLSVFAIARYSYGWQEGLLGGVLGRLVAAVSTCVSTPTECGCGGMRSIRSLLFYRHQHA